MQSSWIMKILQISRAMNSAPLVEESKSYKLAVVYWKRDNGQYTFGVKLKVTCVYIFAIIRLPGSYTGLRPVY